MISFLALYRKPKLITIQEVALEFIPLSIAQSGIIYEILIIGTQDIVSTPESRINMKRMDLLGLCLQEFQSVQSKGSELKDFSLEMQLIGQILLQPQVNILLDQLISEAFPEIQTPRLLTDTARMDFFAFLINEFSKNISASTAV